MLLQKRDLIQYPDFIDSFQNWIYSLKKKKNYKLVINYKFWNFW